MYKSILLLVILGLMVPYFQTQIITFNDILSKKNSNTGKENNKLSKTYRNGDDGNAEEILDFWDFDPYANTKSSKVTPKKAAPVNKENTQTLKTPRGTTSAERKELREIDKLLKEMEVFLRKSQPIPHHERVLQGTNEIDSDTQDGVIPSEEEVIDDGEEGPIGEEEEAMPPEEPEEHEEPEEPEENNEQPPEKPEEGNNDDEEEETGGSENVNLGEIPDEGMATISLSTYIRYDLTMAEFYKQGGQAKYVRAVANVLDIDESQVRVLSIREGSVIIESEITKTAGNEMTKEEAVALMQTWAKKLEAAIQDGRLQIFDNASIMDFKPQILVFTPYTEKNDPAGEGYIIALAVVLSVVIIALVAWFTCKYRKGADEPKLISRQSKFKPNSPPGSQGEMIDLESKIEHQNNDDSIHYYPSSPHSGRQENDDYDRAHKNNSNSKKNAESKTKMN